jgi:hypothetical protein
LRARGVLLGEASPGDCCDSALLSVSGRGNIGAIIRPIADGVGVNGGGVTASTLRLFRGEGVAGGGIAPTSLLALLCASRMWSLVDEDEDNLADLRVDMMELLMMRRHDTFRSIHGAG